VSIEDAADRLGITPDDMRRVIQLGRLEVEHPQFIGVKPRIKRSHLDFPSVKGWVIPPPYDPTTAYLIPEREVERLERGLAVSRAARQQ